MVSPLASTFRGDVPGTGQQRLYSVWHTDSRQQTERTSANKRYASGDISCRAIEAALHVAGKKRVGACYAGCNSEYEAPTATVPLVQHLQPLVQLTPSQ